MINLNFDKPRVIYACDKCCTKLSYKGEPCSRCHNGKGEQVDPVPSMIQPKSGVNLCSAVRRLHKRSLKRN